MVKFAGSDHELRTLEVVQSLQARIFAAAQPPQNQDPQRAYITSAFYVKAEGTCASVQEISAGLSERQSMPRGPCLHALKVMGMSSASGR